MSESLPRFALVAAADARLGIGKAGRLPWRLPGEMRYFRELTSGEGPSASGENAVNAVVMGRRTWESIPPAYRPLVGRANVVVTKQTGYRLPEGTEAARHLDEALRVAGGRARGGRVFVIGGAQLYREAIAHPACAEIYLTRIMADYDCDAFFPNIDERAFELAEILDDVTERGVRYRIERWTRRG
jgi:dihydrofolate reductase